MSSGRRRTPMKTGTLIKILLGIVILAAIMVVGMNFLRKKVDAQINTGEDDSVKTASVTTGSISTTVTGSGTLSYEDVEDLTLPSAVEIETYYVSAGDAVEEGQLLASVNTTSLVAAMSSIQTEIAELDEELAEAEDETVSDEITATVSGRVKKIYAAEDDDVASVMYENSALLLLSLDSKMVVDVETDSLTAGDSVTVTVDGTSYDGTVEKVISGVASITLTDNGPAYGAEANVVKDSTEIGTGTLEIHRPLSVTGYAGTVDAVKVSENEKVDAGDTLFTLTDTSYTANYDSLLAEREELEEKLADLVKVYKEGAVYAGQSGILVTLTKGSASSKGTTTSASASSGSMSSFMGSSSGTMTTMTGSDDGTDTVFSISPDTTMNVSVSIDESKILSLSVGQKATVSITSLEDEEFEGTVTEIGTEGSSSNGVTSYTAVVSIPKNSSMLSGMSASTSIVIEGTDNALLLPADAVNKTRATAYVYTSYDEETGTLGDMVEVTVGISNNNYVEITSGLAEGDTVYYNESTAEESPFANMGGFGGFSGGSMPSGGFSGGSMPSGGFSGGSMPSGGFSGSSFPSGGGNFPG